LLNGLVFYPVVLIVIARLLPGVRLVKPVASSVLASAIATGLMLGLASLKILPDEPIRIAALLHVGIATVLVAVALILVDAQLRRDVRRLVRRVRGGGVGTSSPTGES